MKIKLGSFISSIFTFVASLVLSYIIYKYDFNPDGLEVISFIVTFPLMFICTIGLAGTLLSTFFTSLFALQSKLTVIKVFSLIILILTVILIIVDVNILMKFIKI